MTKKKSRDVKATIMGIMTSICTAWAALDLDNMDFHNPKLYFKLLIIAMPAVGGFLSEIKKPETI